VASDYIGPNYLRPVLDVESHSCGDPASLGVVALSEWIDQWCSEVKRLTGADPIIYCGFSYLSNFEAYLGQKYDLWIARFTENPESQFSIAPWSERTIFQYSQSGALQGITPVDLNVFNGSVAEFRQRLVISEPKVVPSGSLSSGSGTFDLDVSSTGQQQVIIQASDDLENWVDIGAAIMINGEATFSDEEAGNYSARFYRPKP
jgi:hypothetical protein